MAGSSRPSVLIYRQQCKKPFTKRLTGNWGQPYNPPPRQQSAPGRAAALLFDIVDLEGIRGRRVWLWLGLFWCFGTGAFWLAAYLTDLVCSVSGLWLRSDEHTSELQSLSRLSYAVFCLKNKIKI